MRAELAERTPGRRVIRSVSVTREVLSSGGTSSGLVSSVSSSKSSLRY